MKRSATISQPASTESTNNLFSSLEMAAEIISGLSANPKYLPSKLFYNDRGNEIFQAITRTQEYYLTQCEYEILLLNASQILTLLSQQSEAIELVELGAGDGIKTKILLKKLLNHQITFTYIPVDISAGILKELLKNLKGQLPSTCLNPIVGDYFDVLQHLQSISTHPKWILFLGSSIGNLNLTDSIKFLKSLKQIMTPKDRLLIGFDLKKDPRMILKAYDDSLGHTRAFNLNLLLRLNEELGGNFETDNFSHYPSYDPQTGCALSYLISQREHEVSLQHLGKTFWFNRWEMIHTEKSQKYDKEMIDNLAASCGFQVLHYFYDCQHFFVDSLWQIKV